MTAVEEAARVAVVVRRAEVEEVGTCTPTQQAACKIARLDQEPRV